ncbi:MAG: hypothetical protein LC798_10860 [Chloroflexi bacterium]|nr:hypothetical protein [Chloroflexota bacterium]
MAAAIDSPVRQPVARVLADWDRDGYGSSIDVLTPRVKALTIDRTLKGDLPDGVRLVEGHAAAQLTVDLGGDPNSALDAAQYFSRTNTNSPLYGKERLHRPVKVELGMRGEYLPAFAGRIAKLPVDSGARTAQLVALDDSERLRARVALPTVVADDLGDSRPSMSGSWLIDHVLRQNGIYASPPARPNVRFLATLRGSAYPEVGKVEKIIGYDGPALFDPYTGAGPSSRELLFVRSGLSEAYRYTPSAEVSADDGRGMLVELSEVVASYYPAGLIHLTNGVDDVAVSVDVNGVLTVGVRRDGTTTWRTATGPTMPAAMTTPGIYVGVHLSFTVGEVTITWRLGTATTTSVLAASAADPRPYPLTSVRLGETPTRRLDGWLGQVQVTTEVNSPQVSGAAFTGGWNNAFLPTAYLDRSMNQLTGILPSDARDSAALITEIATAEQGMTFFDESGVFRFRSRDWWTSTEAQTVQRSLTATTNLTDLAYDDSLESLRNVITGRATPVILSPVQDVWTSPAGQDLPARKSLVLWISFESAVVDLDTYVRLNNGGVFGAGLSRIRLNTNRAGDGTDWSAGGIDVRWDLITATSAKLTLSNGNATNLYLTAPGGEGGLILAGRTLGAGDTSLIRAEASDARSIAEYGEQTYDIPDNPWRQDRASVDGLVASLIGQLAWPRPVLTDVGIVADPRLQLGDRVRIVDPDGLVLDREYWITGITTRLEGGRMSQRITAREATTVLVWGVGRWGVNTWG